MNTEISATTVISGIAALDASKRVLGPTADLLGQDLAKGYQFAANNIARVMRIAFEKLGSSAEKNGGVHPRVARRICREAQDLQDAFAAEYFGGILASSHRENSDDDSALFLLKILESLSSRQLRLHFTLHYLLGKSISVLPDEESDRYWAKYGLHIDLHLIQSIYDDRDFLWSLSSDLDQMAALDVIGPNYSIRSLTEHFGRRHRELASEGVYVTFCMQGARLFMRALGQRTGDPTLLPVMDVDYSVSSELRSEALGLLRAELFSNPFADAESRIASEIEGVRTANDERVEDLKSEMDNLRDEIEVLKERNNEKNDETDSR